jgi:D-alanine transaminase
MSRIAYVNGRYVPQPQARVNVEDRGYQFADGVYEVVFINEGRMIDEDLHLTRLERSLRELRIPMPMRRTALALVLREVARRNKVRSGLIYIQVTRGVAPREHVFPAAGTKPSIVLTARGTKAFPASLDAWTVSAITHPDQRWARCDIKSTGLLANVLAKQAAREAGAAEAILYAASGEVTEGGSTNVWIVDREGVLRTRPLDSAILPGCTRAALIGLMRAAGVPFTESAFTITDLRQAREVFLTSATSYVKPVTAIDGAAVADGKPGPVSRQLFDLFARHVHGGLSNAA